MRDLLTGILLYCPTCEWTIAMHPTAHGIFAGTIFGRCTNCDGKLPESPGLGLIATLERPR